MSPEFKVFVPEGNVRDLQSFLRHVKGSKITEVKIKPNTEKKPPLDPQANFLLGERAKPEFHALPIATSLWAIKYTPNEISLQLHDLPEPWVNFRKSLPAGDRVALTALLCKLDNLFPSGTLEDVYNAELKSLQRKGRLSEDQMKFFGLPLIG